MRMIDLSGMKFGMLTVVGRSEQTGARKQIKWDCVCECGRQHTVDGMALKSGDSKSCGCLTRSPAFVTKAKTHGLSKSRLYRIYRHMRNRCANALVESYPLYGGRGISVCDEWMTFEPFRDWAYANGYADSLSIDRKDNDLGYFPENCQWSTNDEQARNKRNSVGSVALALEIRRLRSLGVRPSVIAAEYGISRTAVTEMATGKTYGADAALPPANSVVLVTYGSETKPAHHWAQDCRVSVTGSTIIRRKKQGMTDEQALFSPKQTHNGAKSIAKAEYAAKARKLKAGNV